AAHASGLCSPRWSGTNKEACVEGMFMAVLRKMGPRASGVPTSKRQRGIHVAGLQQQVIQAVEPHDTSRQSPPKEEALQQGGGQHVIARQTVMPPRPQKLFVQN